MTIASHWIKETTDETFAQDVLERSKDLPVVVDFWAAWCQPCRLLAPLLEKLATDYDGKFLLVKADTEACPVATSQCGVQSIPAVFGFRDGQPIDAFVGVLPEEQLKMWIDRLLPTEAETRVAEARVLEASDPLAAEAKYREAIAADGELATAKIGLAALLLAQGRINESGELIAALERRGYLEPEAEKVKAGLDLQTKAAESGSVDQCRAAVAAHPDDHALKLQLAETLAAAGQYEEALQTALKLVQDHKPKFGEPARKIMVDIFQLLPDDSELTSTYRRKLSAALY
jgi:putative thioredoxin